MITCPKCGANCDPGEIIGGQCIDCMQVEQQMQTRNQHAVRIITPYPYQLSTAEFLSISKGSE